MLDPTQKRNTVQKISISNFKLLENINPIELKPLTFLFGPNGSGKSSMISAINLFKDFIIPIKDRYDDLSLNSKSNYGTYKNIVTKHELDRKIKFSLKFEEAELTLFFEPITGSDDLMRIFEWQISDDAKDLSFIWRCGSDNNHSTVKFAYDWTAIPNNDSSLKKLLYSNKVYDGRTEERIVMAFSAIINSSNSGNRNKLNKLFSKMWSFDAESIVPIDNASESDFGYLEMYFNLSDYEEQELKLIREEVFEIFKNENEFLSLFTENTDFNWELFFDTVDLVIANIMIPYYEYLRKNITESFECTFHSKNLRSELARKFIKADKKNNEEENQIISDLESIFLRKPTFFLHSNNEKKKKLDEIIHVMNFGNSFTFESKEGVGEAFVETDNGRINMADMSSGFKQIFPIYLRILASDSKDLLLIEQPELHLHPKLQADFINSLVKYKFTDQHKFLIETHSEHMVRKLQILIATGEISKENVSVYYFDKNKIKKMLFEENGFFKEPWPNGFFDDSYNLAKELLLSRKN